MVEYQALVKLKGMSPLLGVYRPLKSVHGRNVAADFLYPRVLLF
jgi:hypothetical protein